VLRTRRRRGGYPGIKDTDRLVKMARPQLNHPAGEQTVGANPRCAGRPSDLGLRWPVHPRGPRSPRLRGDPPVCRETARRSITAASRPGSPVRREDSRGWIPRQSVRRTHDSRSPLASDAAAETRYGWGSSQTSLCDMLKNSSARDWPRCGSMISVIARPSDDPSGGQLPVARFGGVPHRVGRASRSAQHRRAALRCRSGIRSGYLSLSLSRSTSASNGWYRYHPDPMGCTNVFARAKLARIPLPARCLPVRWRPRG